METQPPSQQKVLYIYYITVYDKLTLNKYSTTELFIVIKKSEC